MRFSQHTTRRGITLIETIVSVSILVAAVTGPMVLASQSLKASRDARAELIATHLAEEAIEVVNSIRDNNSAHDTTSTRDLWMQNIIDRCGSAASCVVDVTDHSTGVWGVNALIPISSCTLGYDCTQVYIYPDSALYRQYGSLLPSPWTPSQFKRTIGVIGIDDPTNPKRQVRISTTVTYAGYGGNTHTITISEDLYNWFPALN